MKEKIKILQDMINRSKSIVFFGGAGVSTESGIPDFRSSDGVFMQGGTYAPEQVVSHSFFKNNPQLFYAFYKEKMMHLQAKPNGAHITLAKLEQEGKLKAVITQNIDGLHQMAGSKQVYELHGSIHRNYCMSCGKSYGASYVKASQGIPRCECQGIIKPDVVLYEESLDNQVVAGAIQVISEADMLIIGGTSLIVYPAAGFVDYFQGKSLAVINMEAMHKNTKATLYIQEKIGQVLGEIY